jgi:hypothetical protein
MEPRPNAIIGAFYSHDGCNVGKPFASQSCEAKTRSNKALRRKLFPLRPVLSQDFRGTNGGTNAI